MGRGLSEQQRAILIWILENEESEWEASDDIIAEMKEMGFGGPRRRARYPQVAFGHRRSRYASAGPYLRSNRLAKSEVERASVSRSVRRLEQRGLLRKEGIDCLGPVSIGIPEYVSARYLALTKAGRELAEQLTVSVPA